MTKKNREDNSVFALDLSFCEEEIDKVHRIDKDYKDKNSEKS